MSVLSAVTRPPCDGSNSMCPKPMEKLETVLETVVEPMVFLETVLETVAKPMEKLETVMVMKRV